jgi:hypothetical protein
MSTLSGKGLRKCWIAKAERLDRLGHFAKYSAKQRAEVLRKGYLGLWAPDQAIEIARKETDLGYAVRTENYIDDMRDFTVVGGEVREKTLSILDEAPAESYQPPGDLEEPPGLPSFSTARPLGARSTSSSRLQAPRKVLRFCFGRVILRVLNGNSDEVL